MSRQLPATVTADQTPDWLPAGWVCHSTVLKRGRQKSTYTNLRNGKKFSTKDQVLEYVKMEKIRGERESGIERRKANLKAAQEIETTVERPPWLPKNWQMEVRIGAFGGNVYKMYVNPATGFKTHLKEKVLTYQETMELQASSSDEEEEETECNQNQISYMIDESEEDLSENEYFEQKRSHENVELRAQPERMQKLESRAKTQCVFEDEDMSSDSEEKLPKAETSKCGNASREARVVYNLNESRAEGRVDDVVVECDDNAGEIPGLPGTFSIELNLECEPASDDFVVMDLNQSGNEEIGASYVEAKDKDIDLMDICASTKAVDVTQESGSKSEAQKHPEEARRSVFFPSREAPSHSVLVFENSADDLSNTVELGLNPCADTPQEKNPGGSKKRKKSEKPCSSKNTEKKDTPTGKLGKGKKTLSKAQGNKESSSAAMEKEVVYIPQPNPYFVFEPLGTSPWIGDDSVIRKYLEEFAAAGGGADGELPDFGWSSSFSNIKISQE